MRGSEAVTGICVTCRGEHQAKGKRPYTDRKASHHLRFLLRLLIPISLDQLQIFERSEDSEVRECTGTDALNCREASPTEEIALR